MIRARSFVLAAALAALLLAGCSRPHHAPFELWLYSGANLADTASVARTEAVWRRAAAAGYTTVVLADPKFSRLGSQDSAYWGRLARLRALADELHLELVPALMPVGRGEGAALAVNPDLAEALPVKDALFEVRGGVARLVPDPPVALAPRPASLGGGARLDGDTLLVREAWRPARARWHVSVAPWRCYHLSLRLRTQGFRGAPSIRVRGGGRELAFATVRVQPTQDWTRFDVTFDSQGERELEIALGTGRRARGTLAFTDWALEECGPVNVVRRASTPFVAAGLAEGRDYDAVRDTLLGASPWRGQFDRWHEPPAIRVRRPDGTRFRASWWMAAAVERKQVALCLSDSATVAQLDDEARRVRGAFGARTYMLQHDEIRALGGDPACTAGGLAPGAILAANVRACARRLAPARVCVWNDMFDPFHNAVDRYYLVQGSLAGSWDGLDSNVVVVNWNAHRVRESVPFFAKRGMKQVFASYYDGRVDQVNEAMPTLLRTPGVFAIMYTTWLDRYDDLEGFARVVHAAH